MKPEILLGEPCLENEKSLKMVEDDEIRVLKFRVKMKAEPLKRIKLIDDQINSK